MALNAECLKALPLLERGCLQLGIDLDSRKRTRFLTYCCLLLERSSSVNLTAIRTPPGVMTTLFLDSLAVLPALDEFLTRPNWKVRAVDIGSGAGIPGIPLAIARPEWHFTLVESIGKKARFIAEAVEALELDCVDVAQKRAEEVGRDRKWRDRADVCVARAVAPMATLVELCAPVVQPGGLIMLPKSGDLRQELHEAKSAMKALHVEHLKTVDVPDSLLLGAGRFIFVMRKTGATPAALPRRVGLAKSSPLRTGL